MILPRLLDYRCGDYVRGAELKQLRGGHCTDVVCVAFSPDGKQVGYQLKNVLT